MTENEVAKQIVDAAYRVHTSLGPGLLESVYEVVLAYELEKRGLHTVRQQAVPIVYQGIRIEMGFRADLIIEDQVIVEIKSVDAVAPVHKKQLLTHLRPHQGRHHPHREWTSGLISPKDVLPYLARNRSETEQGYKSVCGGAALCHNTVPNASATYNRIR